MTVQTRAVLHVLTAAGADALYGLAIAAQAGLGPATVYPILARLEHAGWVASRTEDIDLHLAERPRRRYHRLTPHGATQARAALADPRAQRLLAHLHDAVPRQQDAAQRQSGQ